MTTKLLGVVFALILAFVSLGAPAAQAHGTPGAYATTIAALNLRSGPSTGYGTMRVIPYGVSVYVNDGPYNGDWYNVTYAGTTGYVHGNYINPSSASPGTTTTTTGSTSSNYSSNGQSVADTARRHVGYRYVWAGASPATGFDCSGLVQYVYGLNGISLPHSSASQAYAGTPVSRSELRPGDLVVFQGTNGPGISHVAIYYGNGWMISASNPGTGVEMVQIDNGYWNYHWWGARRLVN